MKFRINKRILSYIKKHSKKLMYTFSIIAFTAIFGVFYSIYDEEIFAASKGSASDYEVKLLARLINGEARGEKYIGQVAVGAVVMNRVKSSKFPNTIPGVIYQKGQFSAVRDGQFNKPVKKDSTVYKAAREAVNGTDPSNGAIYYYNPKTAKSKWIFTRPVVKKIGSHNFAK